MTTNKILIAGLLGAVVAFILGFLTWGIALSGFFEANVGSATGVMRGDNEMQWIPMIIGHLGWGFLMAIIFGRWANISTFATGAKAGAMIGFLISLTYDMINLGTTHLSNTTGAIVNIIAMTVVTSIVGGVVAWMLGRGSSATT
jgi:uncharacterized membrane protein